MTYLCVDTDEQNCDVAVVHVSRVGPTYNSHALIPVRFLPNTGARGFCCHILVHFRLQTHSGSLPVTDMIWFTSGYMLYLWKFQFWCDRHQEATTDTPVYTSWGIGLYVYNLPTYYSYFSRPFIPIACGLW